MPRPPVSSPGASPFRPQDPDIPLFPLGATLRLCAPKSSMAPAERTVERAGAYLEAHLDEPVTLAALGREIGVSPFHLQQMFKRVTGVSPKEFVSARRIVRLKGRLQQGDRTGDVVVQTVGSWPTNPASVVGKCVRIPADAAGALLNQNAVKLTPEVRFDRAFLFYLLRTITLRPTSSARHRVQPVRQQLRWMRSAVTSSITAMPRSPD
jgi:AraC-like DNA-binding protein